MTAQKNAPTGRNKAVAAASYVLTGSRDGTRGTRIAEHVAGRLIEREGGRMTGRVVAVILVLLAVAGLAFVAYRMIVLELILELVRERA